MREDKPPALSFIRCFEKSGVDVPFFILALPEGRDVQEHRVGGETLRGYDAYGFKLDKDALERMAYEALKALGRNLPD